MGLYLELQVAITDKQGHRRLRPPVVSDVQARAIGEPTADGGQPIEHVAKRLDKGAFSTVVIIVKGVQRIGIMAHRRHPLDLRLLSSYAFSSVAIVSRLPRTLLTRR